MDPSHVIEPRAARILRGVGAPLFVAAMYYIGTEYRGDPAGAVFITLAVLVVWWLCHKKADQIANPPAGSA